MRPLSVLLCTAGLAVVASGAGAQTLPSWGCNASPSCRQSGFSTVTGQNKEHTGILFDVGWDRGLRVELLRHPDLGLEAPKMPEQQFRVHPPSQTTAPAPVPSTPPPPAAASAPADARPPGS